MRDYLKAISASLVERDAEVRAILLALIAREHLLLVGPPGTGKSLAARTVAGSIAGARYCERLLSGGTTPESIWGPISLSALKQDRYEHVTAGYAADCHVLFLDELFRGSDVILDSLLHLLGPERQALLGTQQVRSPLLSCIAASNSWPTDTHLAAIADRFLVRREVRPISPSGRSRLLFSQLPPPPRDAISLDELNAFSARAASLPIAGRTRDRLEEIFEALRAESITVSDRRAAGAVRIARAAAALEEADQVEPEHLLDLGSVLWTDPQHSANAAKIVAKIAAPDAAMIAEIVASADEIVASAGNTTQSLLCASGKLHELARQLKSLEASKRRDAALDHIRGHITAINARLMGIQESL